MFLQLGWFYFDVPRSTFESTIPCLPETMNMIPEVNVILALAESSMPPMRMHFRAKMDTRMLMAPSTIPTIIRARTACSLPVGRRKTQADK